MLQIEQDSRADHLRETAPLRPGLEAGYQFGGQANVGSEH